MAINIIFDPAKDAANRAKHGLSLAEAGHMEWETAMIWVDARRDYGELRQSALVMRADQVFFVAFVDRTDGRRIISLRKANRREARLYASND